MSEDTTGSVVAFRECKDQGANVTVLAVGDLQEWRRTGHALPDEKLAFVAFEDITEETLQHYSPSIILSPVLATGFDCTDLILLLRNLSYKGLYRAIAQDMPKPALIEREVAQLYPGLDFKIEVQP